MVEKLNRGRFDIQCMTHLLVAFKVRHPPAILYTSLAQGPPLPFLHLFDRPYLAYVLPACGPVAHQPPCWIPNHLYPRAAATSAHLRMANGRRW